jgi:hypothetical protein
MDPKLVTVTIGHGVSHKNMKRAVVYNKTYKQIHNSNS